MDINLFEGPSFVRDPVKMMVHRNKKFRNFFIVSVTFLTALCLSTLLFAYSTHDGSHADLTCTDCHLTQPDPATDTIDTVDFFTASIEDLCISCHSDDTLLEQTNYCLNCHDTF